jgi:hypothetical protein
MEALKKRQEDLCRQSNVAAMEFNEFKNEILKRAKEAGARTDEYKRACRSNDYKELMQVIKDNFHFAVEKKVIDPSLIESCKDKFNEHLIYCNVDVDHGFLLASDNATVKAWGNATVIAWGNATVRAWGNATVRVWGDATVIASGDATVKAWDNAYTTSQSTIECKLYDNAIHRIQDSNIIRYASGDIRFKKVSESEESNALP